MYSRTLHKASTLLFLVNDVGPWSLLGDLYYMDRRYEDSYKAFEQIPIEDSEHARASMMMAYCAIEMHEYKRAMAHLEYAAGFPANQEKATDLLQRLQATQQ